MVEQRSASGFHAKSLMNYRVSCENPAGTKNHLHCVLHFPEPNFDLNEIISNAKRFMAYEIVNCLEENNKTSLLQLLTKAVTDRERKKGQLHKVFKSSFEQSQYSLISF